MHLGAGVVVASGEGGPIPSFGRDVMAVLLKGGCNAGGCHGAPGGKGGLQLSLFGGSPDADYHELVETATRVNRANPEKSWLLRKPSLAMEHEGGARFAPDSESYAILRDWIAAGAPEDAPDAPRLTALDVSPAERFVPAHEGEVQLKVMATFSDGTEADVTRWAVYEPSAFSAEVTAGGMVEALSSGELAVNVRYLQQQGTARIAFLAPRPEGYRWEAPDPVNFVDQHVFAKLERVRTNPAPVCDDHTFVRRATLDLAGRLPRAAEALEFVVDTDPNKRINLVDRLLASEAFADFWALKWADLLRVEEKTLDSRGVETFHGWIRDQMVANTPLDEMAAEILTGRGSSYERPPANYYRALRDPTVRAESVAQTFLGTRLRCAKCHNHPFERWTQDDYYRFSALFDRIGYEIKENERRDKFDKNQFIGEQLVLVSAEPEMKDPRTGKVPEPGLLVPEAPPISPGTDLFVGMAEWVTGPENTRFSQVQANRIWSHLMGGKGIVDPVDDFRPSNPPSNPALLEALADELVASGFDQRHLIRIIMASATYQLSAPTGDGDSGGTTNFAHAVTSRLPAEVMLDALHDVIGLPAEFDGYDPGMRAVQIPGVMAMLKRGEAGPGDHFLKLFGKPARLTGSDAERTNEVALGQVFELASGRTIQDLLARDDGWIAGRAASPKGDEALVRELYWTVLTRAPTPVESRALRQHLLLSPHRQSALEDIVWSLANSKEFLFRH
ncbi:DUF1549 domain-containing protein [soil metagenome]